LCHTSGFFEKVVVAIRDTIMEFSEGTEENYYRPKAG
jgi:hypothetical protein